MDKDSCSWKLKSSSIYFFFPFRSTMMHVELGFQVEHYRYPLYRLIKFTGTLLSTQKKKKQVQPGFKLYFWVLLTKLFSFAHNQLNFPSKVFYWHGESNNLDKETSTKFVMFCWASYFSRIRLRGYSLLLKYVTASWFFNLESSLENQYHCSYLVLDWTFKLSANAQFFQ